EMFGRSHFPKVTAAPYPMTLSPHSFYWFSLEMEPARLGRQAAPAGATAEVPVASLRTRGPWESCLEGACRNDLEEAIGNLLPTRRWFGGKARTLRAVRIGEVIPLGGLEGARLLLVDVEYADAEAETYALPLAFAPDA